MTAFPYLPPIFAISHNSVKKLRLGVDTVYFFELPAVDMMDTPTMQLRPDSNLEILDSAQLEVLAMLDEDNPAEMMGDLLNTYEQSAQATAQPLRDACANQDAEALRKSVHYLAGSSANMGMLRFSKLCRSIESAIDVGHFRAFAECPEILLAEQAKALEAFKAHMAQL